VRTQAFIKAVCVLRLMKTGTQTSGRNFRSHHLLFQLSLTLLNTTSPRHSYVQHARRKCICHLQCLYIDQRLRHAARYPKKPTGD
jgi:hypothetical protein